MKALHILTALLVTGACLSSCEMSDEISGSSSSSEVGYVDLGLTVSENYNSISRATATQTTTTDVNSFIVSIIDDDSSETAYSASYETMSATGEIELPVGTYTLQANSDLTLESVMSEPYYLGTTSLSIVKDQTTSASVICYMVNTKIQLVLDDSFISNMASWEITITDGSNALAYSSTDDDAANPAAWYILVPDGTTYITITVTGTTVDGITVAESQSIAKDEAGTAWTSNDALSITVAIGETSEDSNSDTATDVTYSAIFDISADWTFADANNEYVTIEVDPVVIDSETDEDDTSDDGENDSEAITISCDFLEDGITYSQAEDTDNNPETAMIYVNAVNGFAKVEIRIEAGNDNFTQMIAVVGLAEDTDLISLDTSSTLYEVLSALEFDFPEEGETSYELDLVPFFSLMAYGGNTTSEDGHQFVVTVTDAEGNTSSETIKVFIVD